MKKIISTIVTVILGIIIVLVSLHSVQEIHYLKTFYPKSFTVEEALYASIVELIKVFFVAFPLLLIILFFRKESQKKYPK